MRKFRWWCAYCSEYEHVLHNSIDILARSLAQSVPFDKPSWRHIWLKFHREDGDTFFYTLMVEYIFDRLKRTRDDSQQCRDYSQQCRDYLDISIEIKQEPMEFVTARALYQQDDADDFNIRINSVNPNTSVSRAREIKLYPPQHMTFNENASLSKCDTESGYIILHFYRANDQVYRFTLHEGNYSRYYLKIVTRMDNEPAKTIELNISPPTGMSSPTKQDREALGVFFQNDANYYTNQEYKYINVDVINTFIFEYRIELVFLLVLGIDIRWGIG